MKITAEELLAAGVAPSIVAVFRALEPDGEMDITVSTVERYLPAGIDLFEVARKLLPPEAWSAFEAGNAELDATRLLTIKEAEEESRGQIIEARLDIPERVATALSSAVSNITAQLSNPMIFISWNPGTVLSLLAPLSTASNAISNIASESDVEVINVERALREKVAKAHDDYAKGRVALLVSIIDSLPEEEGNG